MRALTRTGLAFPRGVVGPATGALAEALAGDITGDALDACAAAASAELWSEFQPPMATAVRSHLERSHGPDAADLRALLVWADDPDSDNPLARALAVRAAQELAAAQQRAGQAISAAEPAIAAGGADGAIAVARAGGVAVVEMLDLDPEDFAPEIAAYVDAGETADALDELARATGDQELRDWAHEALSGLTASGGGDAVVAVRALLAAQCPEDPAADAVWVPAILALVEQGFERAIVASAVDAAPTRPQDRRR